MRNVTAKLSPGGPPFWGGPPGDNFKCTFFIYLAPMKPIICCTFAIFIFLNCIAQNDSVVFSKEGIKENRIKLYRNITTKVIGKNLSLPLTDSTEENWQGAFWAMELIRYKSPWATARISYAVDSIDKRSVGFQRALLELIYTNYPKIFMAKIFTLLNSTDKAKIFVMCAEYLLQADSSKKNTKKIADIVAQKQEQFKNSEKEIYLLSELSAAFTLQTTVTRQELLTTLFNKNTLPGNSILYSIQRKNRNYPGIALVRNADGSFITNNDNSIFYVPQLARSITNLPGYLTNGNTPQGIFRITGFDVSSSGFIGPTTNIQLSMPFETSVQNFLKDPAIADSVLTEALYKKLLPEKLRSCKPLLASFYAGAIGRTEIIAHGTTINPAFYSGQPYYPQTPSLGCLCTRETWSEKDGRRLESDQQKLIAALQKTSSINGYCIVIEIDDQQKAVSVNEILQYIKK